MKVFTPLGDIEESHLFQSYLLYKVKDDLKVPFRRYYIVAHEDGIAFFEQNGSRVGKLLENYPIKWRNKVGEFMKLKLTELEILHHFEKEEEILELFREVSGWKG